MGGTIFFHYCRSSDSFACYGGEASIFGILLWPGYYFLGSCLLHYQLDCAILCLADLSFCQPHLSSSGVHLYWNEMGRPLNDVIANFSKMMYIVAKCWDLLVVVVLFIFPGRCIAL